MSSNLSWHATQVLPEMRAERYQQIPSVLWFTGLSGSGKSTLAVLVEAKLFALGHTAVVLDGDNLRHGLCRDLGFNSAARSENIRRVGEVAKLFLDQGFIVLAALISPFKHERQLVRSLIGPAFIEVFVDTPLSVCEDRDPKGLYAKARTGEISEFTGISSPYEPPLGAELQMDGGQQSAESIAEKIIGYLYETGRLN